MIQFKRIHSSDPVAYHYAEQLLIASFPPEEYRNLEEWRRYTDEKANFYNNLILNGEQPIGLFTYWDFQTFHYGEHFAIAPECRNGGLGGEVVQTLCHRLSTPIVLEVEMPDNEMARRRIGFYRRQGFQLWEKPYMQPPYQADFEPLPMYLMAYGAISCDVSFDHVRRTIHHEVYGVI